MFNKVLSALKKFIILRGMEFIFVVLLLTLLLMFSDTIPTSQVDPNENINGLEGLLEIVLFWSVFSGIYVIFTGYALFSLVAFLIVEFTIGINRKNISLLNSLPYFLHSLPIMLGLFGGETPESGLWFVWGGAIVFNFFSPRFLAIFREKLV